MLFNVAEGELSRKKPAECITSSADVDTAKARRDAQDNWSGICWRRRTGTKRNCDDAWWHLFDEQSTILFTANRHYLCPIKAENRAVLSHLSHMLILNSRLLKTHACQHARDRGTSRESLTSQLMASGSSFVRICTSAADCLSSKTTWLPGEIGMLRTAAAGSADAKVPAARPADVCRVAA